MIVEFRNVEGSAYQQVYIEEYNFGIVFSMPRYEDARRLIRWQFTQTNYDIKISQAAMREIELFVELKNILEEL